MGLIALKCPNCAGDIELDENKEFGFCVHCGQKIMIQERIKQTVQLDNTHLIENWLTLAEVALKSKNPEAVEKHVDKVLEADSKNAQAWLLKGCAALLQKNLEEAAHDWERSFSLVKDKNTAITNLNTVSEYTSIYANRVSIDEIEEDVPSHTMMINLAMDPEFGISPAYLPDKILEVHLKNEKICDLTDLFKSFLWAAGAGAEGIGYELGCKKMLVKTKNMLNLCDKYYGMRKDYEAVDPNFSDKISIDRATVDAVISCMRQMFSAMNEIFENEFSLTDAENETIEKYWMQNRAERFEFVEEIFEKVMEKYGETIGKLFSGRIRKEANAMIADFAAKIIAPIKS
jgi:hypothetical protein